MKKTIALSLALIVLSGCIQIVNDLEEDTKIDTTYSNALIGYSIIIPEFIFKPDKDPNRDQIGFGNIAYDNTDQPKDMNILLFGRTPPECKPFDLGISSSSLNIRIQSNTPVWWGRVDYWDKPVAEGVETLPSTPCVPPNLNTPLWRKKKPNQLSAYALCSEKDGKRIVVCVQQITDNPKLAEEIFSTFRWLE